MRALAIAVEPCDKHAAMLDRQWLILQLTDSAFPTGAFAHAGGLEAAWQSGDVPSAEQLRAFLTASLQQASATTAAIVAMTTREPDRFAELDAFTDAMLLNAIANRASRAQGQALLATSTRVFQPFSAITCGGRSMSDLDNPPPTVAPNGSFEQIRRNAGPMHLAPVFGLVHSALHLDDRTAVSNFLFVTLRGLISAAVRLGVVGPLEGQTLQHDLARNAGGWIERALSIREPDDIVSAAPLLDYYQSLQELLYSRLFVS